MNFVEELTWRGMVHTMMPGTEESVSYTHLDVYKRQATTMAFTPIPRPSICGG